jgi:MFS family permease
MLHLAWRRAAPAATAGNDPVRILGVRTWWWWQGSSFFGRLSSPMALLAFTLVGQYAVHSAAAGVRMTGIVSLCAGFAGPFEGHRLDRMDIRAGLQRALVLAAVVLAAIAVLCAAHAPVIWIYLACGAEGLCIARVAGGQRALVVFAVPGQLAHQAHFIASFFVELGFALGPVIVMGLAYLGGVSMALAGMVVALVVSALMLCFVPRGAHLELDAEALHPFRATLYRRADVRAIGALAVVLALGFGLVERSIPLRMGEYGMSTESAGTFMMVLAAGSCLGGIVVSIRPVRTVRPILVGGVLFLAFGVCILPSAFAPNAVVFGLTLAITSVALVPLNGLGMAELETRVLLGERAEAFGIVMACTQIGGGFSGVLGSFGAAAMRPWQLSLLSACLFSAVGLLLIGSGMHHWRRAQRERALRQGLPLRRRLPASTSKGCRSHEF